MMATPTEDPGLIDFDAFRAETIGATIPYRWAGVIYHAPAALSANAVLDAIRLKRGGLETVGNEVFLDLAEKVLGDSLAPLLAANSISIPDLQLVIERVIDAQTAALAPRPNRAARRRPTPRPRSTSSSPGRSSRPTSSGSTGSTSGRSLTR